MSNRVSDILLERYLVDDLDARLRARVESELKRVPDTQLRLEELARARSTFLAAEPADAFAKRLVDRLAEESASVDPPRKVGWRGGLKRWGWVLAPSGTALLGAAALGLFALRSFDDGPSISPPPKTEQTPSVEDSERKMPAARAPKPGAIGEAVEKVETVSGAQGAARSGIAQERKSDRHKDSHSRKATTNGYRGRRRVAKAKPPQVPAVAPQRSANRAAVKRDEPGQIRLVGPAPSQFVESEGVVEIALAGRGYYAILTRGPRRSGSSVRGIPTGRRVGVLKYNAGEERIVSLKMMGTRFEVLVLTSATRFNPKVYSGWTLYSPGDQPGPEVKKTVLVFKSRSASGREPAKGLSSEATPQ